MLAPITSAAAMMALAAAPPAPARPAKPPPPCTAPPAISSNFPDPSVLYEPASGETFVYGTNTSSASGAVLNVPMSRSHDPKLAAWSAQSDALPRLPKWAKPSATWAPAIAHAPDGLYRLYFSASYGFSGRQCIGVATSASADGPFNPTDEVKPLVCTLSEGGAIDPSVFRDDDGAEYLLWKSDANCCDGTPTLYIQKLAADGLALAGEDLSNAPWLLPDAKVLIRRDLPWEGRIIEAPTLTRHDGRYYLFYSGSYFDSNKYAVGYATSSQLLGPYQKAGTPVLDAASGLQGPGGQDVFTGPGGDTWIAFHAWQEKPVRHRALYFEKLDWTTDGPRIRVACDAAP